MNLVDAPALSAIEFPAACVLCPLNEVVLAAAGDVDVVAVVTALGNILERLSLGGDELIIGGKSLLACGCSIQGTAIWSVQLQL